MADQPIWYAIAANFYGISSLATIIAGTCISLKDKNILYSAVGKREGHDVIIHYGDEFRYITIALRNIRATYLFWFHL